MTKEEKAVLWAERIQEFRSSGLTCKQWCTEHEISLSTMGYWLRKSETKEPKMETEPVFAKLPSEKEIAANMVSVLPSAFQIFISENIRIEIADSCRPELLEILLRVLENNA